MAGQAHALEIAFDIGPAAPPRDFVVNLRRRPIAALGLAKRITHEDIQPQPAPPPMMEPGAALRRRPGAAGWTCRRPGSPRRRHSHASRQQPRGRRRRLSHADNHRGTQGAPPGDGSAHVPVDFADGPDTLEASSSKQGPGRSERRDAGSRLTACGGYGVDSLRALGLDLELSSPKSANDAVDGSHQGA